MLLNLRVIQKLLSSVEENFTLKMLIFCVRTENFYIMVLVDKEYTVFDHLKFTVLTKYLAFKFRNCLTHLVCQNIN